MELPYLVSPDSLAELSAELTAAARQIARIALQLRDLGRAEDWTGDGQRAFNGACALTADRCEGASHRLTVDASAAHRLAEQLAAELAVLHRLEHEVMGALHRLAARAAEDVSGEARSVFDRVSSRLPAHGSPDWRRVASTLVGGELQ